jgi:hypothetical protein
LFRKFFLHTLVAFPISVQLGSPEFNSGLRHPAAGTTRMAVPEAAVHKNQFSSSAEDKVWPTWDIGRV